MTVYGETVRTGGWLAIQILAVLAIAAGCVELSRSLGLVHDPQPAAQLAPQSAPQSGPQGGPASRPLT